MDWLSGHLVCRPRWQTSLGTAEIESILANGSFRIFWPTSIRIRHKRWIDWMRKSSTSSMLPLMRSTLQLIWLSSRCSRTKSVPPLFEPKLMRSSPIWIRSMFSSRRSRSRFRFYRRIPWTKRLLRSVVETSHLSLHLSFVVQGLLERGDSVDSRYLSSAVGYLVQSRHTRLPRIG